MIRARTRLKSMVVVKWQSWQAFVAEQHEMEKLAALVTIQSLARVAIAKRTRSGFLVNHSATLLQACWRGFFCRKMLKRSRRYHQYALASIAIQHCYRAHVFRREFHEFLVTNRVARIITRAVRRYCARRKLTRAWLHRLARFHAAIAIQLWFKVHAARLRHTRARTKLRGSAASVMQQFFKRATFLLLFDRRVQVLLRKKTQAAQRLQAAYRAKLARVKFHALKDRLEAQKRDELLRSMWENAYATAIQRCWRKKKKEARRVVLNRAGEALSGIATCADEQEGDEEEEDCGYAIDLSSDE